MLTIDPQGMVIHNARIIARRSTGIERGRMEKVRGIVVHQTNTASETAVFNSYGSPQANGTHFLIAKDGTIYQTAVPPAPDRIPRGLSEYRGKLYIKENSVYEPVTGPQMLSLQYLIDEITQTLAIPKKEIHRHPDVGHKHRTEAATAAWQ